LNWRESEVLESVVVRPGLLSWTLLTWISSQPPGTVRLGNRMLPEASTRMQTPRGFEVAVK
jgi:hypothetical protein